MGVFRGLRSRQVGSFLLREEHGFRFEGLNGLEWESQTRKPRNLTY